MSGGIEVLITMLLYLSLFGWIGWRRGWRRELWVLIIAVLSWIVLQERGDVFVRVANLGGKFAAFIDAGGLGDDPEAAFAALGDAPAVVTSGLRGAFLFLVWVGTLILTYYLTNQLIPSGSSPSDGWAILIGVTLGFFYASVFLPRLLGFLVPNDSEEVAAGVTSVIENTSVGTIVSNTFDLITDAFAAFWQLVEPVAPLVILGLITLLVVVAASTLRRGIKAKS